MLLFRRFGSGGLFFDEAHPGRPLALARTRALHDPVPLPGARGEIHFFFGCCLASTSSTNLRSRSASALVHGSALPGGGIISFLFRAMMRECMLPGSSGMKKPSFRSMRKSFSALPDILSEETILSALPLWQPTQLYLPPRSKRGQISLTKRSWKILRSASER